MQYVFTFAAVSIDPILRALQAAVRSSAYKLRKLSSDSDTFVHCSYSLPSAAQQMTEGKLATIAVHPEKGPVRYALVSSPFSLGRSLSQYLGTIEYTEQDYRPLWKMLLSVHGLTVICLGFEEGVEISDDVLNQASFPWNKWPLMMAALKDANGEWTIKEGPEMVNGPLLP